MSRPDWHYGDVLEHPLMSELHVMFIAWQSSDSERTLIGVVLHDETRTTRWPVGEVHYNLEWAHPNTPAKLIERLER